LTIDSFFYIHDALGDTNVTSNQRLVTAWDYVPMCLSKQRFDR